MRLIGILASLHCDISIILFLLAVCTVVATSSVSHCNHKATVLDRHTGTELFNTVLIIITSV